MRKRVYIGAIVFAVLLLALGRLIVRPPLTLRGIVDGSAPRMPRWLADEEDQLCWTRRASSGR
jgi:hypothetical protein